MKKASIVLSLFAIILFLFISCNKEDTLKATDNSAVIVSASIDLINEIDINTGNQISFEKLTSKKTGKSLDNSCTKVTMNPLTSDFPKTYYADFGNGCIINGIERKGKLKITFSNYITETGSTMTIERLNYYVNNNKVEGKIEYKNITLDSNAPQWTRTVTDGKYTNTKGEVYLNSGSYTIKQTAGIKTITLDDNTYEMTEGNHTVSNENGGKIILTVLEKLVKNYNCDYVSKGKLNVESNVLKGVIDYGNGECDNKATYTQNGIIFPFSM